ncbi:MAG: hypothetical protein ABFD92_06270 [Planctomycetaceae bacterium]|nr:hypothetical protein [Planctomycetaceae bacterium]
MTRSIEMLEKVAEALGPLLDEVVIVGGTVPALLVTDPAAPPARPTKDVDLVVDTRTYAQHASFEERLRRQGFQIASPPISRYEYHGVLVDVMTTSKTMGFSDEWYPEAFATAESMTLPSGRIVKIVRSPLFLATKINAWRERGKDDYLAQDIEDIIAIIDGRPELIDDIKQANPKLRAFLAEAFKLLLTDQRFLDVLPGHIGGGTVVATARADRAIDLMKSITTLGANHHFNPSQSRIGGGGAIV